MCATMLSPVVSCALIAYGVTVASARDGQGARLSAFAVAAVSAVLAGLVVGVGYVPSALVACCISLGYVVATSGRGRSLGPECLVMAGGSLAAIGVDSMAALQSGTTLPAYLEHLADGYLGMLGGSVEMSRRMELASALQLYKAFWPMAYLLQSALSALLARLGTRAAQKACGLPRTSLRLTEMRLPLWMGLAFVLGAVATVLGVRSPYQPDLIQLVGRNVFTAARAALAVQGIAVQMWAIGRAGNSRLTSFLWVIVAVWLETAFFVSSALGLVDLVADFRGLGGGGAEHESKKSA